MSFEVVDDIYNTPADCKLCGGIHPDFRVRVDIPRTHAAVRLEGCQIDRKVA